MQLVKDFAKEMLAQGENILKKQQKIVALDADLIKLESALAVAKMQHVLHLLENSEITASDRSLRKVRNVLKERASYVLKSEASHIKNPETHANQFYLAIALKLAPIAKKSYSELLFPALDPSYKAALERKAELYGVAENEMLAKAIFPDPSKVNKNELCEFLSTFPCELRGKYLQRFSAEELEKKLLNGAKLTSTFENNAQYTGNPVIDTAMIFTYLDLYRKQLDLRKPEYNTLFGHLSGYGSSKSIKQRVAQYAYNAFLAGESLTTLKDTVLNSINSDEKNSSADKILLRRAAMHHTLGALIDKASFVSNPENLKEVSHSFIPRFNRA
ncbi:MAG: hypothetical protein H0W64_03230 [Gammaproteobacteria bacterium]|nr:hypothetical protein [Gammaproteobacteria bacterium]